MEKYIIELTLENKNDITKLKQLFETSHGGELLPEDEFEEITVEECIEGIFEIESLEKNISIKKV